MHYRIVDDFYVLYYGDKPAVLSEKLAAVSLGFLVNGEFFDLCRHGSLALVSSWKERTVEALRKNRAMCSSGDVRIISGRFPLEQLNLCLSSDDGMRALYEAHTKDRNLAIADATGNIAPISHPSPRP